MNQTESVNIPVKLMDSLVACAIRLEYARKNRELEVSPDVTGIVEQALEYSNPFNGAQRPEDCVSQEIRGKPLAECPKAFLGDSEKDYDELFDAVAEASGAMPIHRKSRESLLAYLRLLSEKESNSWAMYNLAKSEYRNALLEIAKANKGIRRLRKKLDVAKKKLSPSQESDCLQSKMKGETNEMVEIPVELLEALLRNSRVLRHEWSWKNRDSKDVIRLSDDIEAAEIFLWGARKGR